MDIQQTLTKAGLQEKEALLYIACLKDGPESVAILTRTTGLKRSTVHYTLSHLVELGLVTQSRKGKRTLYDATPPKRVAEILHKRQQELENALPLLESLRSKTQQIPTVEVREGYRAIEKLYEEIYDEIKQKRDVWFLTSVKDLYSYAPFALDNYRDAISTTKDYRVRELIFNDSAGKRYVSDLRGARFNHPIRLLPEDFPIFNDVVLMADRVILLSFKKQPSAILIDNKDTTETIRSLYEWAWTNGVEV